MGGVVCVVLRAAQYDVESSFIRSRGVTRFCDDVTRTTPFKYHARHKTFWRFCVLQPEVVNTSRTRQPGRCRQQAQAGGLSGTCATLTLFVHCCASIVLSSEVVTRADVTAHPSTFMFACNSRNPAMSDESLDLADMLSILAFSATSMGLRTNLPPQHQIL